jgi:hypothetical protein
MVTLPPLALAAAAPRVVLTLAAALLVACGGERPRSPEGAVDRMVTAARTGDRAGVYQRLGPLTRARIDALVIASRKMSGRVALRPEDFLSVGWAPADWEPAGMRTLRSDQGSAEVEVYSEGGDRHIVNVVRDGDDWKIELPGR